MGFENPPDPGEANKLESAKPEKTPDIKITLRRGNYPDTAEDVLKEPEKNRESAEKAETLKEKHESFFNKVKQKSKT